MSPPTIPAPVWLMAALIPPVASQIVRLNQHDPGAWVFCDYGGRLGGLAILAFIPSARVVAFRWERLRLALWKAALWIVVITMADHYLGGWARRTINAALPATVLGVYPETSGWLYFVDLMLGLTLVAYSEEIIFRRCARDTLRRYLGDGYTLALVTSLLFGAYHWWTGFGNITEATIVGILLMLFLQRTEALWPVFLAHYLTDIIDFA